MFLMLNPKPQQSYFPKSFSFLPKLRLRFSLPPNCGCGGQAWYARIGLRARKACAENGVGGSTGTRFAVIPGNNFSSCLGIYTHTHLKIFEQRWVLVLLSVSIFCLL
uniref:Uncharacterized protein n=1 Tax=Cacopsylla melanoneura TaxID=428564 RepID=A0A8D8XJY3_9HEMI